MVRTLTAVFLLLSVATASAELRYTTHVEARKLPTAAPPDPVIGLLGVMVAAQLPSGESLTTVGDGVVRVEMRSAVGRIPANSVLLLRKGSAQVLFPENQTFYNTEIGGVAGGLARLNPQVVSKRTGEFAMLAGVRAERITYEVTVAVPIPQGIQLPPGIPTTLMLDGEMWVTDQYKSYAAALDTATNMTVPGTTLGILGDSAPEGFVVRQITRSALFGYEVEMNVTNIVEGPVAPDAFVVPAGYREAEPPAPAAALPR